MDKAFYKKKIIDLQKKISDEREAKKRDNESFARYIKNTTSASSKASYKKQKIDKSAYHDRQIEYYKREIARAREDLKRCKK